ncbi:MAG: hypothetical protein LUD72_05660 [Bacteroidales bacterium]|nr:hypothetical protein [Bacteroidales bacterium]
MKKFITLFCLLCASAGTGFSCGYYYHLYGIHDYYTFRLCGDNMTGNAGITDYDLNCYEWALLTSTSIPEKDIREVVYKWSTERLQSLKNGSDNGEGNAFARWLAVHKCEDIIDFLILAKTNENVRFKQYSQWYYFDEDDEECAQLWELVKELKSYSGNRLKDRYTLQIVRALFSLREYEECIKVWNRNRKFFRNGVIKDMTVGYIAGAYERLGKKPRVDFIDKDVEAYYIGADENEDEFAIMCRRYFDQPKLWCYIQAKIHTIEGKGELEYTYRKNYDIEQYTYWYNQVIPIIRSGKSAEMEKWYYTAAFLADKLDKPEEAHTFILEAGKCCQTREMADAIRVLKIYINAKAATAYNPEFEEYIYGELAWLDGKITGNLPAEAKGKAQYGHYRHMERMHIYYWDDVMRKIVLGVVVPLCFDSNYKTRALQYLNMADNCLFKKIGCTDLSEHSSDFYVNLDTLDVKYVIRLAERMEEPQNNLDRLLARNGNSDPQYLYDIIGTKLIRVRKYGDAIPYLRRVSDDFQKSQAVYEYFDRDPFSSSKAEAPDPRYKLHFAQEMYSLERKIATAKDPNDRAEAMLRYCRGRFSASGIRCWALRSYSRGVLIEEPKLANFKSQPDEEAEEMVTQALAMFTDHERGARACLDWNLYETAVTKYPDTEAAEYIRSHCDEICDYRDACHWQSYYPTSGTELIAQAKE